VVKRGEPKNLKRETWNPKALYTSSRNRRSLKELLTTGKKLMAIAAEAIIKNFRYMP
jgi:hypothetical protein